MSKPSGASLLNFIWFLLFMGCVGGLFVWGMDATNRPPAVSNPARNTTPSALASTGEFTAAEFPAEQDSSTRVTAQPTSSRTARPQARISGKTAPVKQPVDALSQEMVRLPGGRFRMGSDRSTYASEKPEHDVRVRPFWIDRHEVTRESFARFVEATGHRTTAERQGWAPVFNPKTDNWDSLPEANWRRPRGPEGRPSEALDPVTQVSWEDAQAFARWAGKRLPTEAEWEYAARGGLARASFPWGNELMPDGKYVSNYWQGPFPTKNSGADGFRGPAYVGSYPPNAFGLYDMSGNVWEWCSDWFSQSYYRKSPSENPPGPDQGNERVQRGGSWFCSPDSMPGYMVYSRMSAPPAAMYPHVGFRCARDE